VPYRPVVEKLPQLKYLGVCLILGVVLNECYENLMTFDEIKMQNVDDFFDKLMKYFGEAKTFSGIESRTF